jgi:N-carbamoyl-L-amino-acid hydrolase
MLASGVFAGVHSLDYAYGRKDLEGKSFGDELNRIGWVGEEEVGARKMHAYFEYHIEQGPILEAETKQIGVVTHCQGLWWLEFSLTGKEAHTGSTPMTMRVNAGLAMARIFEMVQKVAMDAQPGAVGGVGQVKFSPNSRNVLPGTVVFTVDIRSPDQAKLDGMRARIEKEAAEICSALGVKSSVEAVGHFDPVPFDPTLVGRVRKAAENLGYSHMNLISGAGHDACWAAKVAPATMVMCPCVDGLSHNEAEDISKEWAAAGCDVLFHAVVETAEIVSDGTE